MNLSVCLCTLLCQFISILEYICIYFWSFEVLCLSYYCICLLVNPVHLRVGHRPSSQVSHVHIYYMSIPNFSGLQPILPDLVLVSTFVEFLLLLMIMVLGVSLLVVQSALPSDILNLKSVSWLCCMGVLWVLSPICHCAIFVYVCLLYMGKIHNHAWLM